MKRTMITSIILVLICAVSLTLFSCGTVAYWQRQGDDTKKVETDIAEVNESAKHIVYAALDSSGDLIASGDSTTAAAYAVVGYTGTPKHLVIPDSYLDAAINAEELPVTKVLVADPYSSYKCSLNGAAYSGNDARLANNTIVTDIVFGENVVFVGAGVCAGMVNLTGVHFNHVQAGVTYTNAFLGLSITPTFAS